jgi:excinuclease ABC subunit A
VPEEYLEIRGARVHNLKNIDLRLPHNQLIVVTGVSGSGKSSLVFDIVFAEGRRRYVESLSSYARQFLERMDRPEVDEVLGVAPTVAIRQKNTTRNPRSTVATATEIHDFLRLLFARVGRTFCTDCGRRVTSDGVDTVADEVLELEAASRWYVLFPARPSDTDWRVLAHDDRYSDYDSPLKARLAQLRERGFNRLYQGGRVFEFSTPESLLDIDFEQPIYVLVDRIAIGPDIRERVVDSMEIAYGECGEVRFEQARHPGEHLRYSSKFECRKCGLEFRRPEPRMFSFNSFYGACSECEGYGRVAQYAMDLIVSRPDLSLRQGAVKPWQKKYAAYKRRMLKVALQDGVPVDVPYRHLSAEHRNLIEEGRKGYGGIRGFIRALEHKKWKPHIAALLSQWRRHILCPKCGGARLSQEVLHIRVGGESIDRVLSRSLSGALGFFENLELEGAEAEIAASLLIEIKNRLRFLNDVGLEYLTLDRLSSTLSGGEAQRIQLASSLGSRLVGVCYVLDEPSIGLHSRDTGKLIGILKELRDLGNTIFVVEHDHEMMRAADYLVDLGPAAGEHGGEVVFSGTYGDIQTQNGSLTGQYLSGQASIPVPEVRRKPRGDGMLRFKGASRHNLKNIDVDIPLGLLTVVTGVSGSGKSTLMHDIVHRSLRSAIHHKNYLHSELPRDVECEGVNGYKTLRDVILIDQALLERTSRSVPATYLKVFDEIRGLFAKTVQARRRGLRPAHFSFNIVGGRCDTCNGSGKQTIDMQFLADVDLPCEDCEGRRFRSETLDIAYRGKNIWEVLEMTVDEALRFFADSPRIVTRLSVLVAVGLGYIRLGQPATQLSGGEAQRLKLALHISDTQTKNTLFLFDEPTTGLHFDDIKKLLRTFDRLVEKGATLIVIEHNLDVIKCADWIIDLGPEGGDGGGHVVAKGTPEKVAVCAESHTARYLREALA